MKHSYCINIIGGFFFSYQVQKIEFGRLSCPPQEAAWKMQNKEKRFTLGTLGGIKFIWTSSPPSPPPTCFTSCQGFWGHHIKNSFYNIFKFLWLKNLLAKLFGLKKDIFENSYAKSLNLSTVCNTVCIFVLFVIFVLYFGQ